ncbi:MAG: AMP-dependent synthetase/ligase [Spirochaetes bacterium]|nr:AMP-dependent synthetase/ligase [Spirochaetota bacterium]
MALTSKPWDFLEEYRGSFFSGEWPTLPELFRITAHRFPDRPCFTVYDPHRITLTYRQALEKIERTATYLRSLGVDKASKVAVTGANSPEWAIAYLATLFANAVVVPIDYQLKNSEIENLLRTAEVKVLFVDEEKFDHFATKPAGLQTVLSLSPNRPSYIYDLPVPTDWAASTPIGTVTEHDLAAILFTSGTTGHPKGVMLSHRNLVSDCFLAQANLNIYPTDVFYALLPIHHSYCMLAVFIESFSVGAETVFGKRLAIKQILSDLKEANVTMFLGVPLLFNKVLNGILRGVKAKGPLVYGLIRFLMWKSGLIKKVFHVNPGKKLFHSILEKASLASVRICISGGGPLSPAVFRKYNQLGIDFVQGYGLTETSPILTLNPVEHYKERSVGKVIPQVEMKILDPDDRGAGEIAVKGPMVMMGYYQMPEETKAVFTEDGFFKTGDVGYLDHEHYLYLTGRKKNLIVTEGGKNVYPEEIEDAFQLYEEIGQILVRGYISDPALKSEEIEALIYPNPEVFAPSGQPSVPKDQIERRIQEIVDTVNRELLPYQRIKRIRILEEPMEMTTTKKIKRHAVKVGT